MTKRSRVENIKLEQELGREAWQEAMVLIENKLAKGSLSRACYSVFHHARALLYSVGLEPKTHEGTLHLFNLHFVKKGILSPERGRLFSRLQKYREQADYDTACVFTVEDVKEELREAGEFILQVDRHLTDKGLSGK